MTSKEFYPKDIIYDDECLKHLLSGAHKVAKAVGATMGPCGNRVIFGDNPNFLWPVVTKDGVTVAKEITLGGQYEKVGADLIRQAAVKQVDETGDGTTLTTILAYEIFKEGLKSIQSGANRSMVIEGIQMGVEEIIENLTKLSKDCKTTKDIKAIATISANNDPKIGTLVSEAIEKVGNQGLVLYDKSPNGRTEVEYSEGFEWDKGIEYSQFFTAAGHTMIKDPVILVTDNEFRWGNEIAKIAELVHEKHGPKKPILIISPSIKDEAIKAMCASCEAFKKGEEGCMFAFWIRPAGHPTSKELKLFMGDIAAACGAKYVSESLGIRNDQLEIEVFGSIGQLISNGRRTILKDTTGDKRERLSYLKSQFEQADNAYDKKLIEQSLARLEGGIAVIHVGGATDSEQKERMDRVEDSIKATNSAIEEGIVDGGGVALLLCKKEAFDPNFLGDAKIGREIIFKAIEAPIRTILNNANKSAELIIDKILSGDWFGYDIFSSNGTTVAMREKNIVDPTKVIRTGLINAASVATLMLKSSVMIVNQESQGKV